MCLALPAKITSIDLNDDSAQVNIGGILKTISIALVGNVKIDDYVLVHVGFALNKISEEEANRTLRLFEEAGLVELSSSSKSKP